MALWESAPFDVPEPLFAAIELAESGGDPYAVSEDGALGPMQTMPATEGDPGYGVKPLQADTPQERRRLGRDYYGAMLNEYDGDHELALMAYNWGPGSVDDWVAGGRKGNVPRETREYVAKLLPVANQTLAPQSRLQKLNAAQPSGIVPDENRQKPSKSDEKAPEWASAPFVPADPYAPQAGAFFNIGRTKTDQVVDTGPEEDGIGAAVGEFLTQVPAGVLEGAEMQLRGTADMAWALGQKAGWNLPKGEESMLYRAGNSVGEFIEENFGESQGVAGDLGRGVGQFGLMIGEALIPYAGIPLVLAGGVAMGADEAAQRARDFKGDISEEDMSLLTIMGGGTGLTEFIPVEIAIQRFVPAPFRKGVRKYAASVVTTAFAEGGQEYVQAILQDLIAQMVYNPDQLIGEGALYEGGIGAGAGGITQMVLYPFMSRRSARKRREGEEAPPETPPEAAGESAVPETPEGQPAPADSQVPPQAAETEEFPEDVAAPVTGADIAAQQEAAEAANAAAAEQGHPGAGAQIRATDRETGEDLGQGTIESYFANEQGALTARVIQPDGRALELPLAFADIQPLEAEETATTAERDRKIAAAKIDKLPEEITAPGIIAFKDEAIPPTEPPPAGADAAPPGPSDDATETEGRPQPVVVPEQEIAADPYGLRQPHPDDAIEAATTEVEIAPTIDVAARSKAVRRRLAARETDIVSFLARRGGIKDVGGELAAMDAKLQRRPFEKGLIQESGLDPDMAREAAVEAGFLRENSTEADLYEAIDQAFRGMPGLLPETTTELMDREDERRAQNARAEMEEEAGRFGLDPEAVADLSDFDLAENLTEMAAQEMTDEEAADFIEDKIVEYHTREGLKLSSEEPSGEETQIEAIPFEPAGKAGEGDGAGEVAAKPDQRREEPGGQAPLPGRAEGPAKGDLASPEGAEPLTTEETDQGEQVVIPGAERISDRELAERKSEGRMKATAPQKDADEGLFDVAGRGQTDLMDIAAAAAEVDTDPTDAQKEAGNYKKGHVTVQGLDITIENPKGSTRSGTDPGGQPWQVEMPATYGYIKRTEGADGEQVDVYLGDKPEMPRVFVVDQKNLDGSFDEHKVFIGFETLREVRRTYAKGFSDGSGPDRWGGYKNMTLERFKAELAKGKFDKPVAGVKKASARRQEKPPKATTGEGPIIEHESRAGVQAAAQYVKDTLGVSNPEAARIARVAEADRQKINGMMMGDQLADDIQDEVDRERRAEADPHDGFAQGYYTLPLDDEAPFAESKEDVANIIKHQAEQDRIKPETATGILQFLDDMPNDLFQGPTELRIAVQTELREDVRRELDLDPIEPHVQGSVTYSADGNIVLFVRDATGSKTAVETFIHENGHIFLDYLMTDSEIAEAKAIWSSLRGPNRHAYQGYTYPKDQKFDEWFAESFVDYYKSKSGRKIKGGRSFGSKLDAIFARLWKAIRDLFSNEKSRVDAFFDGLDTRNRQRRAQPRQAEYTSMGSLSTLGVLRDRARAQVDELHGNLPVAPNVGVEQPEIERDLNPLKRPVFVPQRLFKDWPALARAVDRWTRRQGLMQSTLTRIQREWDQMTAHLSKPQMEELGFVLFKGDRDEVAYTREDLENLVDEDGDRITLSPAAIDAYFPARRLVDKLGNLVGQHERSMRNFLRRRIKPMLIKRIQAAADTDKAEASQLLNRRYAWRAQFRSGRGDPALLGRKIDDIEAKLGNDPALIEALAQLDQVDAQLNRTSIKRRDAKGKVIEGYFPHKFFGSWAVYRLVAEENEAGEIETHRELIADYAEHGFHPTKTDAITAANRYAEENPDEQILVRPVAMRFAGSGATALTGQQYKNLMGRLEEALEIDQAELKEMTGDIVRPRNKRRWAGFKQHRKGIEGYSTTLDMVMRAHIGEVVRFVHLDKVKYEAISLEERMALGAESKRRPVLGAEWRGYVRDILGEKQPLEKSLDALFDKPYMTPLNVALAGGLGTFALAGGISGSPMLGLMLGGWVGYRFYSARKKAGEMGGFHSRSLTGELLSTTAHLKLGAFLNVFSPVVNLTQIFLNTASVMPYKYVMKGFGEALATMGGNKRYVRMLDRHNIDPLIKHSEISPHMFDKQSTISKMSMFLFDSVEKINRATTFLGAYHQALDSKAKGVKGNNSGAAQKYAMGVVNRTQFDYSNVSKPAVLRNVFARVPLQFKNFVMQQIAFVAGLENKKEVGKFLAHMGLVAGALGLPGIQILDWLLEWLTDESLITEIKREALHMQAKGEMAGTLATMLSRGLPGLIGVDISTRAGMGEKFLPRLTWDDLMGPFFSTVSRARLLAENEAGIVDQLRNLSTGLGAPLKALESAANGLPIGEIFNHPREFYGALADDKILVTSPYKKQKSQVKGDELGLSDLGMMAVGGSPIGLTRVYDFAAIARHDNLRLKEASNRYMNRIANSYRANMPHNTDKFFTEVNDIRREARESKYGLMLSATSIRLLIRDLNMSRTMRTIRQSKKQLRPELIELQRALQ